MFVAVFAVHNNSIGEQIHIRPIARMSEMSLLKKFFITVAPDKQPFSAKSYICE